MAEGGTLSVFQDKIKEELERVKTQVKKMKKTSVDDASSEDEFKSIMKDVEQMEEAVKDISMEADRESQKSKGKKKKLKDKTILKKSKSKQKGDIPIDSKLANKINLVRHRRAKRLRFAITKSLKGIRVY